jgi:hypothetical protein
MRRLALVAAAGNTAAEVRELAELHGWLDSLPSQGVVRHERLTDVPLDACDVLWVRGVGPVDVDARLRAWLERGGRLLATGAAVRLATELGVAHDLPEPITLSDSNSPSFGLAGFGAHPLFTGLRDGALMSPALLAGDSITGYSGRWPANAAVVAVARRGFDIDAETVLAWEYPVVAGGILCLAFSPARAEDGAGGGDPDIVLANALVGDAVPHRERVGPARVWVPRGQRAISADASGVTGRILLRAPDDVWPASRAVALDLTPAAAWTHAGRRLLVRGRPGNRREVWAPPFRVMREVSVRDAITCAPGHVATDEIASGLALGDHRLQERWVAAADVPAVAWEIAGPDGVEVTAEWEVDLCRAWPYPVGAYGSITFDLADDGRGLAVSSDGGPRALFATAGGRLSATAVAGGEPLVRVRCEGHTPLRIVTAAGTDADELERAVRVLERDGVSGLASARARRAEQLDRYGTAFEASDQLLSRGFAWSRQRGDEALVGVPGVGRAVLSPCPRGAPDDAWCFGTQACATAAAQLIAGNREPARELLKFLVQVQHPSGGLPAHLPHGGLASAPEPAATVAFLDLAERLLAWTGDTDALRKIREPLRLALDFVARLPADGLVVQARTLDALEPLVGGPADRALTTLHKRRALHGGPSTVEAHAVVEAAAAALRRAPGSLIGTGAAPALLEAVASLWGLEPDAPDAALSLSPILPAGWPGYALRRLRVGRTLIDLELLRRPETVVARTTHRFGPRLVLTIELRGAGVIATEVDDIPLASGRARFEAHGRHEVRFFLGA